MGVVSPRTRGLEMLYWSYGVEDGAIANKIESDVDVIVIQIFQR